MSLTKEDREFIHNEIEELRKEKTARAFAERLESFILNHKGSIQVGEILDILTEEIKREV